METSSKLTERLFQIHRGERAYIHRGIRALELNIYQARALHYIGAHPGTMQKKLATYLGKSEATVTNILKVLQARLLIDRQVVSGNERQKQLRLTAAGEQKVAAVHAVFATLETNLNAQLATEERTELMRLLAKVAVAEPQIGQN